MPAQPAILGPLPPHARFLTFGLTPGADPREAFSLLRDLSVRPSEVLGLGAPLLAGASRGVPGLRSFPAIVAPGVSFPSTQGALWAFLQGDDPGDILHRARKLAAALGDAFRLDEDVAAFKYAGGRDLTGYEDGTENPTGDDAIAAALVSGAGEGKDGGSFVSVQRWVHDLPRFERHSQEARDHLIGRRREDNEELDDAPEYAHVKRAAQESFDPPAFLVRRSMPWGDAAAHGLVFVAFASTLDPFERILRRMSGLDDGISDGLLRFSRAVTGAHFFCPPTREGKLDLRAIQF